MAANRTVPLVMSCFLLLGGLDPAVGYRLRRTNVQSEVGEPSFEVVAKTSIVAKETSECLCEAGEFWHWRIKQCIKQGDWGYECGFFPAEHHRFVCKDNLQCDVLDQSKREVKTTYVHDGAVPASCQHCSAEQECKTGDQRDCLSEHTLSGEACATVRVTIQHTATIEATKEHTAKATAEKTAKGVAKASAKETVVAGRMAQGEAAGIKAQVRVQETANATATATATAEATHEATAKATASASAKVSVSKEGVGQAKKCMSLDDVKKSMGLEKVPRVGPVLGAQIISTGDKLAFDGAYEEALEAAMASGESQANDAAKALAAAKAAKDAELEAEAKAAEKAAWAAEAGASNKAHQEANAAAEANAQQEASDKASSKANAAAADAAAGAQADAQSAAEGAAAAVTDASIPATDDTHLPTKAPEPTGPPPKIDNKEWKEDPRQGP